MDAHPYDPAESADICDPTSSCEGEEFGPDAMSWTPNDDAPTVGTGRPPPMGYSSWRRSQATELGGTDVHAWYRRCRTSGCRVWAGPCTCPMHAKSDGTDRQHLAHQPTEHGRAQP
jgi:hypothetical protein